MNVVGSR